MKYHVRCSRSTQNVFRQKSPPPYQMKNPHHFELQRQNFMNCEQIFNASHVNLSPLAIMFHFAALAPKSILCIIVIWFISACEQTCLVFS